MAVHQRIGAFVCASALGVMAAVLVDADSFWRFTAVWFLIATSSRLFDKACD